MQVIYTHISINKVMLLWNDLLILGRKIKIEKEEL